MTKGDVDGCNNEQRLSTHTDTTCSVKCEEGYRLADSSVSSVSSVSRLVSCEPDAQDGDPAVADIECLVNQCAALNLPTGVEGLTGSNACVGGGRTLLTTHGGENSFCQLACSAGFSGINGQATCPPDARDGANATLSISCVEVICNPYAFPAGVIPGDTRPCSDGQQLTTNSASSCGVQCDEGYTGEAAVVSCPKNANWGTSATSNITCGENSCASFPRSEGVTSGDVDGCDLGEVLTSHTNRFCSLQCDDGFSTIAGSVLLSPTVTCAINANDGDAPSVDFRCESNRCRALELPPGTKGAGEDACKEGVVLSSRGNSSCSATCIDGYFKAYEFSGNFRYLTAAQCHY